MTTVTAVKKRNRSSDRSNGFDGGGYGSAADGVPFNKSIFGLLVFLTTEVMFFGGLISTFLILRAGSPLWPPPGQPRLPVGVTAVNTLVLLLSAWTMRRAVRAIRAGERSALVRWLAATAVLGGTFLAVQGTEWVRLVKYGLTFASSVYAGTFYSIIGAHGLHVLGGMTFLLVVLRKAVSQSYSARGHLGVTLSSIYWYFVVGIWPVLYVLVYLS